jgi:hypothetical protein
LRGESRSKAGALPRLFMVLPYYKGGSIAESEKRPRGRPRTGRDPVRTVRIGAELEAAITAWIDRQPDPKPSRSEAIRRLIEKGLGARVETSEAT